MVASGASIAQWLTFGIESEGVFYTFVYDQSLSIRRRSTLHTPARRLACVVADGRLPPLRYNKVPIRLNFSGSPMVAFVVNIEQRRMGDN
jgi:hypothetical protein